MTYVRKNAMLAAKFEEKRIKWPMYAQPKLDGFRAMIGYPEVGSDVPAVFSRPGKLIANYHVQRALSDKDIVGLDGELMLRTHTDAFGTTASAFASRDGYPDFRFHVFDCVDDDFSDATFDERIEWVEEIISHTKPRVRKYLELVPTVRIANWEEFEEIEEAHLNQGYEGTILRGIFSTYKHGRATPKENRLTKVKRFEDSEALVTGFEELQHNENEAFIDETGHQKRSDHQENKVPGNMLGKLVCKTPEGVEFRIGTGFTRSQREKIWAARGKLMSPKDKPSWLYVKYKHQPHGAKDKPRTPVFLSFRDEIDL